MPKPCFYPTLETTLAIIKPDFMSKRKAIHREIVSRGFHILMQRTIHFTPEQAAEFYKDYEKTKWFMLMVLYLTKGVSQAFILSKENAVLDFLALLKQEYSECNKGCICKECMKSMICDFEVFSKYPIHASTSHKVARTEINMVFPNFIVEPIITSDTGNLCFEKNIIQPLVDAFHFITEEPQDEPITATASFLQSHNPSLPSIIENEPGVGEKIMEMALEAERENKELNRQLAEQALLRMGSSKTTSSSDQDSPTSTSTKNTEISSSLTLISSSGSGTTSTCKTEDSSKDKERLLGIDGLIERKLFTCDACDKIVL